MINPENPKPTEGKNLRSKSRDFWSFALSIVILLIAIVWIKPFSAHYASWLQPILSGLKCTCRCWHINECSYLTHLLLLLSPILLLELSRVTRVLHEGAHLVAAHWYFGVSQNIRAKDIHVYVDGVPKKTWLIISLFPLVLPLAVFLLIVLFDLHAATFIAFTMLIWSSKDFVNIVLVYRSPGKTVRDIEEGLFVVD